MTKARTPSQTGREKRVVRIKREEADAEGAEPVKECKGSEGWSSEDAGHLYDATCCQGDEECNRHPMESYLRSFGDGNHVDPLSGYGH